MLRRTTALKKRALESLLNGIFQRAADQNLLSDKPEGAIDATGLESRHTSQHYVKRCGYKRFLRYSWPKVTLVCDTQTHLIAACIVTQGPSQDSPQFEPALLQASRHIHFDCLLADAGYDGEHNHRLARESLGIRLTVIDLNPRRSRKWPKAKYRRQMKKRFCHRIYNHRWQIESVISRHKRLLGSSLRSRNESSREKECFVRILTHNLMILRRAA